MAHRPTPLSTFNSTFRRWRITRAEASARPIDCLNGVHESVILTQGETLCSCSTSLSIS